MRCRSLYLKICAMLLVVGCASPPATAPKVVTKPAPSTALEVLSKMAHTYATATTYADRGTVTTIFSGSSSHTRTITFETAFARDRIFRFEYRKGFSGRIASSDVIWSDFVHTYTQSTDEPEVIDDGHNLKLALGAKAGVSAGSTYRIPGRLLGAKMPALRDATIDGTESIDGHACWRIKGTETEPTIIWIDRSTYVIRKIVSGRHFAQFDTTETVTFSPMLGGAIDVSRVQAPDLVAHPPSARKPLPPEPWIGVSFDQSSSRILSVVPNGPADQAGLQAGDTVEVVGGKAVVRDSEVENAVWHSGIGVPVTFTVSRNGSKVDISVTPTSYEPLKIPHDQLINKPAPAFDLPVVSGGGSAKFSSLLGSVVVVVFWSGSCPPCTDDVPALNALARKYPELHVIGISSDAVDDIRAFTRDNHVSYTLASDIDGKTWSAYSGTAIPMIVAIDKGGVVRVVQLGTEDGDLETLIEKLLH